MKITKLISWNMAHRMPNHDSACHNLHGHYYTAELQLEGSLVAKQGSSREGMVTDFGIVKELAQRHIYEVLDHACMVWERDDIMHDFYKQHVDLKHLIVPFVPTAENIAVWVFDQLSGKISEACGSNAKLVSVTIWETPTSCATYEREVSYE